MPFKYIGYLLSIITSVILGSKPLLLLLPLRSRPLRSVPIPKPHHNIAQSLRRTSEHVPWEGYERVRRPLINFQRRVPTCHLPFGDHEDAVVQQGIIRATSSQHSRQSSTVLIEVFVERGDAGLLALGEGHTGEEGFCEVMDVSEFQDGSVGDGVGRWGVGEVGCWEV